MNLALYCLMCLLFSPMELVQSQRRESLLRSLPPSPVTPPSLLIIRPWASSACPTWTRTHAQTLPQRAQEAQHLKYQTPSRTLLTVNLTHPSGSLCVLRAKGFCLREPMKAHQKQPMMSLCKRTARNIKIQSLLLSIEKRRKLYHQQQHQRKPIMHLQIETMRISPYQTPKTKLHQSQILEDLALPRKIKERLIKIHRGAAKMWKSKR